ncbi:MAG: bifunctional UDP-N-acetylmuramoyl-tripeptide:D-alanyl-D-alanine ligase/alanine racemase [Bacteroidetes bacterium]|nr:MAG: bifunctional UDP-N-acetylmuramoyl-tripeptide:D-alanyl-D-alanine ligase/alanine racemase [Bacteroidota bacterium]
MLHKGYSGKQIAEIIDARLISENPDAVMVQDILIDSRRLISPENLLFFALVSKRNNGHFYIKELLKKGVRYFVVSETLADFEIPEYAAFFVVDNTLEALQKLTAFHRDQFDLPVIGITGSNGKTVIKEWLYQLLSTDKQVIRSPKSYNSQIGVPLSVWQISDIHDFGIFEAGISQPDEMQRLQPIINPDIGIFTNIGDAHNENFLNIYQKIGEKLKLFTKAKMLIYSSNHKELKEILIKSEILKNLDSFSWGYDDEDNLVINNISKKNKQTVIGADYKGESLQIEIPFIDDASVENAMHCWATLLYLGYKQPVIANKIKHLQPVAMRLELKEGINNCTVINDSYNSDINSLSIAIDFTNQQNQHNEKVVVLSDILQSGRSDIDLYTEVNNMLVKNNVSRLIGIGPAISRQAARFELEAHFFESTSEFISNYSFTNFANQTILLKGARVFEFEQINKLLQQKVHETVFEINLNALINNLNYYRSLLKPETLVMAMVKAFSYGSGSFEIANVLQYHQVNYLAVAYADEGVELRKSGINLPIMVMNPEAYAFDTMIKHQLEPEIFNFRALELLEKTIKSSSIPLNKPVKIHLKFDTGMHRLGFGPDEIDSLISRLKKNEQIYVQSVFSHLAASDKPSLDDFTHEQINLFNTMAHKVSNATNHPVLKHIVNSAGIERFPEAHFDMVRLGIGLYGTESVAKGKLENVVCLRSSLSQIKKVKKGESVSYNRSWVAKKDTVVGIVSVGYADGLMRNLGNGKLNLWIKNQPAKIIGDICMDMCMVDLTGMDASEGDDVVVFDGEHAIRELAEKSGTITYEILSRISRRVKRVYYYE